MKKILGLAAGILLTAATYAQSGVTFADAKDGYDKASTQSFNFTFETSHTAEELNKNGVFYVDYFTTTVTEVNGHLNVNFKLVEDTEMARRVITRYFSNLEIKQITVNGNTMLLQDFMDQYIMSN